VARWYGAGFKAYTAGDGFPDSTVYSIQAGKDNTLWFCTNNGTTRFDGLTWRTYTRADSCLAYPRSLAVSGNGFIWMTDGETVSRFDGKTWKNYVIFANHVDGWMVASSGGPDSTFFYMNTHNYGTVHFPGYGMDLYKLEGSQEFQWDGPEGRSGTLSAGISGDIWVGAGGSLYHVVEGKTSAQYSVGQNITSIAVAPDGAVWCGTDKGLFRYGFPIDIGVESEPALPKEFAVVSNYPNPFNPTTVIQFTLQQSTFVELDVYSITGQKVRALLSGPTTAGMHSQVWDGKDDAGKAVSSGIYIEQLRAGNVSSSHCMTLLK
jgi:hypothetical protein